MKPRISIFVRGQSVAVCLVMVASCQMNAQVANRAQPPQGSHARQQEDVSNSQPHSEAELESGIMLTRKGLFREAIPHLRAAQGRVINEYAAEFDLALCYVGVGEFKQAIQMLRSLRGGGRDNADVDNLLAQAYVGNLQSSDAFDALKRAATLTPQNEKLYLLVADACTDRQNYALGLKVVDLGLRNLPLSARLHYERGVFLSLLDQFDLAKTDFKIAGQLSPESESGYMAGAREDMFAGNLPGAIQVSREAIKKGLGNPVLLSILGEALLRSGTAPGEPEFAEAQAALEKSLAQRPNSPSSQVTLAKAYIMLGRIEDAFPHLEIARELDPENPAVYANLAAAFRRRGQLQQAKSMLAILAEINRKQAEKIASAPGDRRAIYGSVRLEDAAGTTPK
jgi:tetratricopeptide (TPR) repeat protein